MRKKTIQITVLFLTALITLTPFFTVYGEEAAQNADNKPVFKNLSNAPIITSPSAVLIESNKGQTLYDKQSTQRLHLSVANKIMTAIVVIEKEKSKLDSKVTISKDSVEAQGSALSLEVGEKYTVEDLLYSIMLTSANDAAKALAEYTGGDVSKFVSLMNNKANELNLKDTHFENSTGLYNENQYTTARDLAMLIRYAINSPAVNPAFNKIFSTKAMPWVSQDGTTTILTSQNKLFWSYESVDGGKVGYNNQEQQTVVTTSTKGNQRLICVVAEAPEKTVFEESVKLLDFGFNNFRTSILVQKDSPLRAQQIGDKEVDLISITDVYYTHPAGENYIKDIGFSSSKNLVPPVKKSQIVGTARYVLSDDTIIDINLYPATDVSTPDSFYSVMLKRLNENRDVLTLVVILVGIEAVIMLYHIFRFFKRIFTKKTTNLS